MILSIKLKNFKSHKNLELEFTSGIVSLTGSNGSGKTSIIEAIGKCMFFYYSQNLRQLVSEDEDKAEIEIKFISLLNEDIVTVYNSFCSGKDPRSDFWGKTEEEEVFGSEATQNFVKKHLQLPLEIKLSSIWSDSIGIPQSKFAAPFISDASSRRKTFEDALGISKYYVAHSNLGPPKKELENQINIIQLKLRSMTSPEEVKSLESKYKAIIDHGVQLKSQIETLQNGIEDLVIRYTNRQELVKEEIRLKEVIRKQERIETEILLVIDKAQKEEYLLECLEEKQSEINEIKYDYQSELKRLQETLDNLKQTSTVCPFCLQEVTEKYRQAVQDEYSLKLKKTSAEFSKYYDEAVKELDALKKELSEVSGSNNKLYYLKEELIPNVEDLRKRHTELLEKLTSDAVDRLTLNKETEKLGSLKAQLDMCRKEAKQVKEEYAAKNSKVGRYKELEEELEELNQKLFRLNILREAYKETAPIIASTSITAVNLLAQEYLNTISPEDNKKIIWNSDYSLTCIMHGVERPFDSLSGGEQMLFAISMRLALVKYISGLNFIFLDEPTTHLDYNNRQSVANCIRRLQNFTQIFVVAHDDTFNEISATNITLD